MPLFTPPTIDDLVWVSRHQNKNTPEYRLFRFLGPNARGRSVLKIDGTYRVVDYPDQLTLATATEVYLGGSVYEVSEATLAAIHAGGVDVGDTTTYTIYSDLADGRLANTNAVYANARAGTGTFGLDTASAFLYVGQQPPGAVFSCHEAFISFDTSVIPDSATILSATLSLYGSDNQSVTDFTVEARLHDWGAAVTSADWVAGASLDTKTLLASWSTAGYTAAYNAFTSEAAFLTSIDKTGTTRLLLCSDRMRAGTQPTTDEYMGFSSADVGGTTQDPKLVIEVLG